MQSFTASQRRVGLLVGRGSTAATTMGAAVAALTCSTRGIRTQIAPRPHVTVITYLDRLGNPVRNRVETELSIVKTRDNLFWLQRVLSDGSHIRWRIPGLDKMKHATSFEGFSLHDIDEGGGIMIPFEVVPWHDSTPPEYADAINIINSVEPNAKLTRKDRRYYRRRLYAAISESTEKASPYYLVRIMLALLVLWNVIARALAAHHNNKSFFDGDVYTSEVTHEDSTFQRFVRFGDNHPEHNMNDYGGHMRTPGQRQLSAARHDVHGEDVLGPDMDSVFIWQVGHLVHYHHWPKPINE